LKGTKDITASESIPVEGLGEHAETGIGDASAGKDGRSSPSIVVEETSDVVSEYNHTPGPSASRSINRHATFFAIIAVVVPALLWALMRRLSGYPFRVDPFLTGVSFLVGIFIGMISAIAIYVGAKEMNLSLAFLATVLSLVSLFLGDFLATCTAVLTVTSDPFNALGAYYGTVIDILQQVLIPYLLVLGGTLIGSWELWKLDNVKQASIQGA
jgi:hypothetical protein